MCAEGQPVSREGLLFMPKAWIDQLSSCDFPQCRHCDEAGHQVIFLSEATPFHLVGSVSDLLIIIF